jgi:hypothetical protein
MSNKKIQTFLDTKIRALPTGRAVSRKVYLFGHGFEGVTIRRKKRTTKPATEDMKYGTHDLMMSESSWMSESFKTSQLPADQDEFEDFIEELGLSLDSFLTLKDHHPQEKHG